MITGCPCWKCSLLLDIEIQAALHNKDRKKLYRLLCLLMHRATIFQLNTQLREGQLFLAGHAQVREIV